MEKIDLKPYIEELQYAHVTITHTENETILSYNGLNAPALLNEKLLKQKFSISHFISTYFKSLDQPSHLDLYASILKKHIDMFFLQINNFTITKCLYIEDSIKGHIQFIDLDESLQRKIAEFAKIQNDFFYLFLDFLSMNEETSSKNDYPYVCDSKSTDLVSLLMAIYAKGSFRCTGDESIDNVTSFINLTCDQLNTPRVKHLSSVISNIKKKAHPEQTLKELIEALLKSIQTS